VRAWIKSKKKLPEDMRFAARARRPLAEVLELALDWLALERYHGRGERARKEYAAVLADLPRWPGCVGCAEQRARDRQQLGADA
jgi:hypothetical protein